ncbi:MAG: DUF4910 domain-containing protein [Candidatus Omnitrophica bacterium]|nr:DUF4910 domain-containing protein [Candidatus Omnitrophota bacterium]
MMELIEKLWFLRRDIVSDGFDEALRWIGQKIPLKVHAYPSGDPCWTWTVPEKWSVGEAFIETLDGHRLLDVKTHPLHVMSYSLAIHRVVKKEELFRHLHTNPQRPKAIPFEFKYYQKDWGFCIQHERLAEFTENEYRVVIDSVFEKGALKVGECVIPGEMQDSIVVVAHLCHPAMVNDDLSGVAVLVDIAQQLQAKSHRHTFRFVWVPETIGSLAYLSHNEELIPLMRFGIFLEMLGNANTLALQLSRQGDTRLDRIMRYVLKKRSGSFREGSFRKIVCNDEMVFNGPGVNIPMVSLSRYPYPEYHTSDDSLAIISKDRLEQARDVVLE